VDAGLTGWFVRTDSTIASAALKRRHGFVGGNARLGTPGAGPPRHSDRLDRERLASVEHKPDHTPFIARRITFIAFPIGIAARSVVEPEVLRDVSTSYIPNSVITVGDTPSSVSAGWTPRDRHSFLVSGRRAQKAVGDGYLGDCPSRRMSGAASKGTATTAKSSIFCSHGHRRASRRLHSPRSARQRLSPRRVCASVSDPMSVSKAGRARAMHPSLRPRSPGMHRPFRAVHYDGGRWVSAMPHLAARRERSVHG
jgi:hypothetical protein